MEKTLGILRHALTFIGGIFVTEGYVTESEMNLAAGAIVTLAGVIWSIVSKNKAKVVDISE